MGDWKDYLKWKREKEEGMLMCAGSKMNAFFTFRQVNVTPQQCQCYHYYYYRLVKAIRKEEDDKDDHHFHLGYGLHRIL